jgi:hypothetical protein
MATNTENNVFTVKNGLMLAGALVVAYLGYVYLIV